MLYARTSGREPTMRYERTNAVTNRLVRRPRRRRNAVEGSRGGDAAAEIDRDSEERRGEERN